MNFNSVSGKNWVFMKFNSSDIKKYSENYSLTEIVAKLLSIRKKNIGDIALFLYDNYKSNIHCYEPHPKCYLFHRRSSRRRLAQTAVVPGRPGPTGRRGIGPVLSRRAYTLSRLWRNIP